MLGSVPMTKVVILKKELYSFSESSLIFLIAYSYIFGFFSVFVQMIPDKTLNIEEMYTGENILGLCH